MGRGQNYRHEIFLKFLNNYYLCFHKRIAKSLIIIKPFVITIESLLIFVGWFSHRSVFSNVFYCEIFDLP